MDIVKEYVSGIIIVSVVAILLENILPESHHKKYINITIGLVVMLAIISPFSKLTGVNPMFVVPEQVIDDSDLSFANGRRLVADEFSVRLAKKIEEEIKTKCGKNISVSVDVETNDEGEITGIKNIYVYPLDEEILSVICQTTGLEEKTIRERER